MRRRFIGSGVCCVSMLEVGREYGGRLALLILKGGFSLEWSLVVLPSMVAGEVAGPLDLMLVLYDATSGF